MDSNLSKAIATFAICLLGILAVKYNACCGSILAFVGIMVISDWYENQD